MARMPKEQVSYICIRECFTYNKHFIPGDPFPENWLRNGYKPNGHFAPATEAYEALEQARMERMKYGPGDDPRSNIELKEALSKWIKDIPPTWTRKQIWLELIRHENAEARDITKRGPGRPPANKDT